MSSDTNTGTNANADKIEQLIKQNNELIEESKKTNLHLLELTEHIKILDMRIDKLEECIVCMASI